MTSPADMLADVGRALYGEHWRMQLSRALDIDDDTIRRWMHGRPELRADHGVFADALALLARRADEINAAAKHLERWRNLTPSGNGDAIALRTDGRHDGRSAPRRG